MRFLYFLFLIFFVTQGFSQNNVVLSSGDGRAFKLILKGKTFNEIPQAGIILEKILKDTLAFEVELENRKKFPVVIYLLEKGISCKNKEFNYRLDFDNNNLKTRFTGVYDIISLPDPLVPTKPVIDTSSKYRNTILGHFCELKEKKPLYFNNLPKEGSCSKAMPADYMDYTAILISKAEVPDDKFTIVENVCRNNCISVEQLVTLLAYIDYEIEKLKIIRIAYFSLSDPQNQKKLEKSFRFESSLNELNQFLKNTDQYKLKASSTCTKAASQLLIDRYTEKIAAFGNDGERYEALKKGYSDLCYSAEQVAVLLNKFIHDREKLEAAKLLYFNCVEKEKYMSISGVFSYNQTISELKDFVDKQAR
jgi:hypothetical protein